MIANHNMLFLDGTCQICGVRIAPLKWHSAANGLWRSARETHFEWHKSKGDTL